MRLEDFVEKRRAGTISAGIDPSHALQLIDRLPGRYRAAHAVWSWVWMLSIPIFIAVSIFGIWWLGLLLLLFGTPAISRATKKAASDFVLEHAQEDEEFFTKLVAANVLVFREEK